MIEIIHAGTFEQRQAIAAALFLLKTWAGWHRLDVVEQTPTCISSASNRREPGQLVLMGSVEEMAFVCRASNFFRPLNGYSLDDRWQGQDRVRLALLSASRYATYDNRRTALRTAKGAYDLPDEQLVVWIDSLMASPLMKYVA